MDRTSLEIAIAVLGFLFFRGIFVLLRRKINPGRRAPDPVQEDIQPTEEVVFLLSFILLAIAVALWRLHG